MKRTALYERHVRAGAKMTEFGGWDMPLQYTRITDEHMAVRKHAGIFDVSHMGDVTIKGPDAGKFLDYLLPTEVSKLETGKCTYTAFLDENGNIMDDTIVYKVDDGEYFFVPNAGPTDIIVKWIDGHRGDFNVQILNFSEELSSIALQGPESEDILSEMGINLADPFTFYETEISDSNPMTGRNTMIISGTGYTGENGIEFILPNSYAEKLWDHLIQLLDKHEGLPCGLGARDTLRMEKGMLLSGHDFNRDRTPYECSISFIMNTEHDFIGKEKAVESKENSTVRFRGIIMEDKGIPREEYKVYHDGEHVGDITSGTMSPILRKGIGLGFIDRKFMKAGTEVYVDVRGVKQKATVSRPKMVP